MPIGGPTKRGSSCAGVMQSMQPHRLHLSPEDFRYHGQERRRGMEEGPPSSTHTPMQLTPDICTLPAPASHPTALQAKWGTHQMGIWGSQRLGSCWGLAMLHGMAQGDGTVRCMGRMQRALPPPSNGQPQKPCPQPPPSLTPMAEDRPGTAPPPAPQPSKPIHLGRKRNGTTCPKCQSWHRQEGDE